VPIHLANQIATNVQLYTHRRPRQVHNRTFAKIIAASLS